MELDLIFIPLIRNTYNATSENYNKYLEGGLLGVPVLAAKMYPYNTLIVDKGNGFLYTEKHEILPYFEHLYAQRALVKTVGISAGKDVRSQFNYTVENINVLSDLFSE